jgi:hypothetical protein
MEKVESVLAIQSIVAGFIQVMTEHNGMSLKDLVKKLAKVKSLFTIAAILQVHGQFAFVCSAYLVILFIVSFFVLGSIR